MPIRPRRDDRLAAVLAGIAATSMIVLPARADVTPHAGMLRYPDVSKTQIVFSYANDLWVVPREGGVALPLASPPGAELYPKFSLDGKTIAFVGNYEGNRDIYTIPVQGGTATRVTYHPEGETLCDWTPDGKLLFFTNAWAGLRRQTQLFTVDPSGGLPTQLPVPYGANGAISPDGVWLAYTPHTIDLRTWKRYRGGMATDIWLLNLKDHTSKKITDWEGTDTLPMWHGSDLYYLADSGPEHRLNIWSCDNKTHKCRQVTEFKDFDVKWPSIGPGPNDQGEIVFQCGSSLYLLDLGTRKSRMVEVTVPGDRPRIRAHSVDASRFIEGFDVSTTGKRAVVEARGDIWTVPAQKGSPRNLTRTSDTAERDPAWSPDGKSIAYFSDATGEYELYVAAADGKGETRQLTKDGTCFRGNPTWSPDSKRIAFTDKTGSIFLHTLESGATRKIDQEPWASQSRLNWSQDSRWIAYAKRGDNRRGAVWLYNVDDDKTTQVTSGMFDESAPAFDRKGDFLYSISARSIVSPEYEDLGTTFIYAGTEMVMAYPLRRDVASPYLAKSDEETGKEDEKKDGDKKDNASETRRNDSGDNPPGRPPQRRPRRRGEVEVEPQHITAADDPAATASAPTSTAPASQPARPKRVKIDLDGFERRGIILPIKRGSLGGLVVTHDGKLIYTRGAPRGSDEPSSIRIFDPGDEKKEEKTVMTGTGQFVLSANGKKLLIRRGRTMAIVDAAANQNLDKPMPLSGMRVAVDPRSEWKQIFTDAWRLQRDYFYDPNMHHVNWGRIREQYSKMLADCVSREDVSYVIAEMISELNVGHTYYRGGDVEDAPTVSVGMPGCDFELHDGAYRIKKILEGGPWDADARGPLSQPGVNVKEGDYLLAVNQVPVNSQLDPCAAFQGLGGRVVTLTVSSKPRLDKDARDVVVELLSSDADLRFRAWVEHNRAYVDKATGGKVGYIYVPNTGVDGQNELFRQFYGQIDKGALIIDERWNGGGQIPTRFIELLNRPVTNYWARRDGKDWIWPPDSHQGPKCMLINGLAGSGGDAFPSYFRQARLGKLIGKRTWGGLVGISGNPGLIDGGSVTVPTFAYYKANGTWGIEGHGVDPDLDVTDDPAKMIDGQDPQLDAAIKLMLDELRDRPYVAPKRPAYPDRSGMGIRDEDK